MRGIKGESWGWRRKKSRDVEGRYDAKCGVVFVDK